MFSISWNIKTILLLYSFRNMSFGDVPDFFHTPILVHMCVHIAKGGTFIINVSTIIFFF